MNKEDAEFDVVDWMNQRYKPEQPFTYDHLRPVLSFALLWNVFESTCCNRRADFDAIAASVSRAVEDGRLTQDKYRWNYKRYVDWFQNRYTDYDAADKCFKINGYFNGLAIRSREQNTVGRDIQKMLFFDEQESHLNITEMICGVLLIIYRIRNNTFHGNKAIEALPEYTELFYRANNFLEDFLEDWK